MTFQLLPCKYQSMIDSINDTKLKNIYFQFEFLYLSDQICQDCNTMNMKSILLSFFKEYKLIIYNFIDRCKKKELPQNAIICIEKKCIIIEGIDIKIIEQFLNETKSSLINVTEFQINEEIKNFNSYFSKTINENAFVKLTINSIAGYLIRRFFYPTNYFKDPSFFNFRNKSIDSFEFNFKNKFNKLLSTKAVNDVDGINIEELFKDENKTTNNGIEICNFIESEFIKLKAIHCNISSFYLVIHIDTLHVFLMKKFDINDLCKEQRREINFCQKYSHRCFTPFYGFVKRNENIIGLIYEYMSNNTLSSYISKMNKKESEINTMFSFMTMIRISEGIQYLHSNSLIHRDLKPMNILINHDGIAYISDFETIRQINDNTNDKYSNTNDIGSNLYMSPEQYYGENYSYPTDIYSFGLIIYFQFTHKNQNNFQMFEKKRAN